MTTLLIDIGGTYIKHACINEELGLFHKGKIKTPQDSRESLINAIYAIYLREEQIEGIAISMPGIIDSANGQCLMGGALRYNDGFKLQEALYQKCPVPIYMENDAKCAAYAEAKIGCLKQYNDAFVILFGTMIGGAFIKDHKLHRGKHFSAGEVSYIITNKDVLPIPENVWGNLCGVGRLCKLYAEELGLDCDCFDGHQVFEAVNDNDERAIKALDQYALEIAVQIFNIQTVLDPEVFALGGGISAQPALFDAINRNLEKLYANCIYHVPHAKIIACQFLNDANLYGAYECFKENIQK